MRETQRISIPHVRDFHEYDLDRVLRVCEESRSPKRRAGHGLAKVLGALRDEGVAVVAAVGEIVVGAGAARVADDHAWVVLLATQSSRDWVPLVALMPSATTLEALRVVIELAGGPRGGVVYAGCSGQSSLGRAVVAPVVVRPVVVGPVVVRPSGS